MAGRSKPTTTAAMVTTKSSSRRVNAAARRPRERSHMGRPLQGPDPSGTRTGIHGSAAGEFPARPINSVLYKCSTEDVQQEISNGRRADFGTYGTHAAYGSNLISLAR